MGKLKEKYLEFKKRQAEKKRRRLEDAAQELFQIKEYNHELWFTYNGYLFAPCCIFESPDKDNVTTLITIRELYIERNLDKCLEYSKS